MRRDLTREERLASQARIREKWIAEHREWLRKVARQWVQEREPK
jgi:hypothetical protein